MDTEFSSYFPITGSLDILLFLPVLTIDRVIKRNSYCDLWATVDTLPFFCALTYDDLFYSDLWLVRLFLIEFNISTEFGIRYSAVFQQRQRIKKFRMCSTPFYFYLYALFKKVLFFFCLLLAGSSVAVLGTLEDAIIPHAFNSVFHPIYW